MRSIKDVVIVWDLEIDNVRVLDRNDQKNIKHLNRRACYDY